jgi:hypothetical protein
MIQFDDLQAAYDERQEARELLERAGYESTGGGMGLGGWDTFIEDPDNPEAELCFSSIEQARKFIASRNG